MKNIPDRFIKQKKDGSRRVNYNAYYEWLEEVVAPLERAYNNS